jgi:preprotein translocase subunit SecY
MTSEFARRAGFTLGALLIYRLGCNIPLPGIKIDLLEQLFRAAKPVGLLSLLMPPNGIHRLAIFALGIIPYITAAVFLQVAGIVIRPIRTLRMRGVDGRRIERRITLCITVALAAFQAYGVALALEGTRGAIEDPGALFLISTVVGLAGGTIFLVWLSEQITFYGIGNGIALILLSGGATAFADQVVVIVDGGERGFLTSNTVLGLALATVLITGLVVLVERAQRRFAIDFSDRRNGDQTITESSTDLIVKLNPAGIIPVLLASWAFGIMFTFASLSPHWSTQITAQLVIGRPAYFAVHAILIVIFTLLYTAYVFDPGGIADRIQRYGGTIRLIPPAEPTAAYLDQALSRTALFGAIYLAAICLGPDIVTIYARVPFHLGGLPLLITVCTALDLETQVRGQLRFDE